MVHLQIETFGRTRILQDGLEVKWSAQSARELLLYLLSYPDGRTRAEILNDLWAGDEEPSSNNRFRVTLHRLRSTLGGFETVLHTFGRFRLAANVWHSSDVYRLYAALGEATHESDPEHRIAALQRALALYRGNYLADQDAGWAEQAREEHKAAYVQAHLELSLLHCHRRDCEHSVDVLVTALRTDPYVGEEYHQRLMTCLSVVEGKYPAIDHYRRFVKFLHDDLNDVPLSETRDMARRVAQGEHICQREDHPLPLPALARHCPLTSDGHCSSNWPALIDLELSYQP